MKAVVPGALVLVVLLFFALLVVVYHQPPLDITVRHVKSVQTGDITTISFEVKNHTPSPYAYRRLEVQVRNGNVWTGFQDFDINRFNAYPALGPRAVASYTVNVTNLPAQSVVRLSLYLQKPLHGVEGFARRAEFKWRMTNQVNVSLNPYDTNSIFWGKPTVVTSEEFVEPGK
jgi:hypothetical protein